MIEKIFIENFFGFEDFESKDVARINVIIGKNDSGKTGLMKLLYATSRSMVELERSLKTDNNIKSIIGAKLNSTFFPRRGGIGSLVTKGAIKPLNVEITYTGNVNTSTIKYSFSESANKEPNSCTDIYEPFTENFNSLFIPAKEVLTNINSIALSRENYNYEEFDDTYYDLVKSLRVLISKDVLNKNLAKIETKVENLLDGKIIQTLNDIENPFLFKKGKRQFTMPLTAEGIKKIGILTTLLKNKQLDKNTIVFFDEPETALHPDAQRKFAELIFNMVSIEGIQVFLATHSYYLVNQFSNIARREKYKINCISLYRNKKSDKIEHEITNLQHEMPTNSIMDEAVDMFNEDTKIELGL